VRSWVREHAAWLVGGAVVGIVALLIGPLLWTVVREETLRPYDVSVDGFRELDERTLFLSLAACDPPDLDVDVTESAERVTVSVQRRGAASDDDCGTRTTVVLDAPLGDRSLIDASTNRVVPREP
jgi:hypothetical protein